MAWRNLSLRTVTDRKDRDLWFIGLCRTVAVAPVLPHILGSKYEAVVPAVRWLALIPLLRCIHSFLADALSGAGLQRTRTGIQVFVAVINIGSTW